MYQHIPPSIYDEVQGHLQEMLDLGTIVPSKLPWASPVVLVWKKDRGLCFCIKESLDSLAGATVFSTLDLKSGYWQVKMHAASQPLTVFTMGFYECARMPFRLTNAPATFQ